MNQKKKSKFLLYTTSNEKIQEALYRQELRKKFRIGLMIACAVIFIITFFLYRYRTYHEEKVIKTISEINNATSKSFSYKSGVVAYNEDGISYMNANGKVTWTKTYSIKNPIASYCDDYIAIANKNGNEVCIFDGNGKVKKFSVAYQITDIEIASQGVIAVILKNDDENYIELYDMTQKKLVTIKATSDTNGYPMDIDLSEDGQKLVVSYLLIDGIQTKSRIAFYDFGDDGQDKEDRLVAGFDFKDTIIPKIKYMNRSTVCAVGDNKVIYFNAKHTPTKKKEVKVTKNIKSIAMTDSKLAIVVDNNQKNSKEKYDMKLYNTSGSVVATAKFSYDYNHVVLGNQDVLLVGNNDYMMYSYVGKKLYSGKTQKRIYAMSQTGKQGKYLVTFSDKLQIIRLR